jgi:hypothetical protein
MKKNVFIRAIRPELFKRPRKINAESSVQLTNKPARLILHIIIVAEKSLLVIANILKNLYKALSKLK